MDFFARLREERERLGLSLQQVADVARVHVKTVRRWESHIAIPLDAMVPLLAIGYDVQYVASGVRSKNVHEVREKGVDYDVHPGYAGDEIVLMRRYRLLTVQQREQAHAILAVLALDAPTFARGSRALAAAAKARKRARAAAGGLPPPASAPAQLEHDGD
ncbi:MAG: hypothetical protein AMXMBFR59_04020 [Rhodanobacteraceae bacterium]